MDEPELEKRVEEGFRLCDFEMDRVNLDHVTDSVKCFQNGNDGVEIIRVHVGGALFLCWPQPASVAVVHRSCGYVKSTIGRKGEYAYDAYWVERALEAHTRVCKFVCGRTTLGLHFRHGRLDGL